MDLILWQDSYDLGIPVLDAQHKYLTEITNRLFEILPLGSTKEDVDSLLDKLSEGFREHMETEEKMLAKAKYEGLAEHHDIHERYAQRLKEIKDTYDRSLDPEVTIEDLAFLKQIWIYHITETDRQFLPALKEAGLTE